ncbi:MAG: nitroreductase [Acidimicrobiales bacterium]
MKPTGALVLAAMLTRRSVQPLGTPGPTDDELRLLMRAAITVPDHGGLRPWRLVVVTGEARAEFGAALAESAKSSAAQLSPATLQRIADKAFSAPTLVALVAAIDPKSKVPEWEQTASAACVGYAITLAAHAIGLGAIWKSTPFADGARLREILAMDDGHRFLGWINLGQRAKTNSVARPELATVSDVVHILQRDGTQVPLRIGG